MQPPAFRAMWLVQVESEASSLRASTLPGTATPPSSTPIPPVEEETTETASPSSPTISPRQPASPSSSSPEPLESVEPTSPTGHRAQSTKHSEALITGKAVGAGVTPRDGAPRYRDEGRVIFSRRWPTVERRFRRRWRGQGLGDELVELPTDSGIAKLLQEARVLGVDHREVEPVVALDGGRIWPLVHHRERDLHFFILPVAATARLQVDPTDPEHMSQAIVSSPGVTAALEFVQRIKATVFELGPRYTPKVVTELSNLLHATIPFGRFLGTGFEATRTALASGFRTSAALTEQSAIPCWKPHILTDKRRGNKIHFTIAEELRMSTYGESRRPLGFEDEAQYSGVIRCKADLVGLPVVRVKLGSVRGISDMRIHQCADIPDPDMLQGIRFEPPLDTFELASYAVCNRHAPRFRGEYHMREINGDPLRVSIHVSFTIDHDVPASQRQPMQVCALIIPLKNRGVLVDLDGTQMLPRHMEKPLLDPTNSCIVWRLGSSLPTGQCELRTTAIFEPHLSPPDHGDPFFTGTNAFVRVFCKMTGYTWSGLNLSRRDVKVDLAGLDVNLQVQTERTSVLEITMWNSAGAVRGALPPDKFPLESAREAFRRLVEENPAYAEFEQQAVQHHGRAVKADKQSKKHKKAKKKTKRAKKKQKEKVVVEPEPQQPDDEDVRRAEEEARRRLAAMEAEMEEEVEEEEEREEEEREEEEPEEPLPVAVDAYDMHPAEEPQEMELKPTGVVVEKAVSFAEEEAVVENEDEDEGEDEMKRDAVSSEEEVVEEEVREETVESSYLEPTDEELDSERYDYYDDGDDHQLNQVRYGGPESSNTLAFNPQLASTADDDDWDVTSGDWLDDVRDPEHYEDELVQQPAERAAAAAAAAERERIAREDALLEEARRAAAEFAAEQQQQAALLAAQRKHEAMLREHEEAVEEARRVLGSDEVRQPDNEEVREPDNDDAPNLLDRNSVILSLYQDRSQRKDKSGKRRRRRRSNG